MQTLEEPVSTVHLRVRTSGQQDSLNNLVLGLPRVPMSDLSPSQVTMSCSHPPPQPIRFFARKPYSTAGSQSEKTELKSQELSAPAHPLPKVLSAPLDAALGTELPKVLPGLVREEGVACR